MLEALTQGLRKWYVIIIVGVGGSAATYFLKDNFRPVYEAEAAFNVTRKLPTPKVDTTVQVPQDDPPEPETIAKNLRDEALTNDSLGKLFKAKPKVFDDELKLGRQKLINYYRKHTQIGPKTESIFGVSVRAKSAAQAKELADWITVQSTINYRRMMRERSKTLATFTKKQAGKASAVMEAHEKKMIAYLRKHPDLLVQALDRDRRLTATGPDRMRVQSVLRKAGTAVSSNDPALRALMEERNRLRTELRALDNADNPTASAGSSKLKELASARAHLERLKASGLGDGHPSVKQAKRKVTRLKAEASSIRPGQVTGTSRFQSKVKARLKAIDKKIRGKIKKTSSSPRLEARWGEMVREQQLLLSHYESLNRLASAAAFANRLGNFEAKNLSSVKDRANIPKSPKGLKPWMVMVAGFMGSFAIGLGLALLIGSFDRKIYSAAEVGTLLRMPLLSELQKQSKGQVVKSLRTDSGNDQLMAWSQSEEEVEVGVRLPGEQQDGGGGMIGDGAVLALPPAKEGQALVSVQSMVMGDLLSEERAVALKINSVVTSAPHSPGLFLTTAPRSPGADQVRLLASRLQDTEEVPFKTIVVGGWEPKIGRTTIAANLALAMAESRKRTLLVDACGGDGSLTRMFGLRPEGETSLYKQLSDHMAGSTETWTLFKVAEALSIIPAGNEQLPMAPMLSSLAFTELVEQLKSIFDVLIFDSQALGQASDAVVLSQQADAFIYVVRRRRSTLKGATQLVKQVDPDKIQGAVFNKA